MEAEATGLEDFGLLVILEFLGDLRREVLKPFFIKVRLSGEEHVGVVFQSKGFRGALLGLRVVCEIQNIGSFPSTCSVESWFDAGSGGCLSRRDCGRVPGVFGEESAGHHLLGGGGRREEVHPGSAKIDGPSNGLRPGTGDGVKRQSRVDVLQHAVEFLRVAEFVLHEVEVVIGEDRGELSTQRQHVAMAHEDGFDTGEFLVGDLLAHERSVDMILEGPALNIARPNQWLSFRESVSMRSRATDR